MEFDKTKIYSAVNADDVKIGSEGYFADSLKELKDAVEQEDSAAYREIAEIKEPDMQNRFSYKQFNSKKGECYNLDFNLFYLVKKPKEKKLRPYKNTDEMIKDFETRFCVYNSSYFEPLIWIKGRDGFSHLVTDFYEIKICVSTFSLSLKDLAAEYTFLDGSPCGVEE